MANTIVYGEESVGITPDASGGGGTDYDICADTNLGSPTNGMYIAKLIFKPSQVNDVICILDGVGGPSMLYQTDVIGQGLAIDWYGKAKPFYDASASSFGTAANVRITIHFKPSPTGV